MKRNFLVIATTLLAGTATFAADVSPSTTLDRPKEGL